MRLEIIVKDKRLIKKRVVFPYQRKVQETSKKKNKNKKIPKRIKREVEYDKKIMINQGPKEDNKKR